MKHGILTAFIILQLLSTYSLSANTRGGNRDYMSTREVIGRVTFSEGDVSLSSEAKTAIDKLVPKLKKSELLQKVVRIEGFATKNAREQVNVPISMSRAWAVLDYIKVNHQVDVDIYLSGFGGKDSPEIPNDQSCSAEIVLYDLNWDVFENRLDKKR